MLNDLGVKYGTDKSSLKHNYLIRYERYLAAYRETSFRMVEIGGFRGASLLMWRDYFPQANILCLDIEPSVMALAGDRIQVKIGDASDERFLSEVLTQYPDPLIILDDGSHRWDHQIKSFERLFPHLCQGGIYIVEDTHTSFEPGYTGESHFNFIEYTQKYIHYLQWRSPHLDTFKKLLPAKSLDLARMIDSITILPRAIMIHKL